MTNLATAPVQQKAKFADPVVQRAGDTDATSIERRSPARQGSRGDKYRVPSAVIVHIVQASDVFLLLFSGLLAKGILAPHHWLRSDGPLFLATLLGSAVATVFLSRADAYQLRSLYPARKPLKILPLPLLVGGGSMIVCLFLMRDASLVFREWPFVWLLLSAVLLTASRCYLSRLIRGWTESGRLARRVAVIGAGEFSREFIERLRAEPHAYTVVGLYDDRRSRVPGVQEGVRVRGSVRDLLERSREERIDLIVIALPLRAAARISRILEEIGSAVADICLTTDFAGFRYRSSQISSVGSNPVVFDRRAAAQGLAGGKEVCLRYRHWLAGDRRPFAVSNADRFGDPLR